MVRQWLTALETIPPLWGMGQVQTGEPSWGFMKGLPAAPFAGRFGRFPDESPTISSVIDTFIHI